MRFVLVVYKIDNFWLHSFISLSNNSYINYQMNLYKVQAILDKRYNPRFRRQQYKIKWVGYPEEQATWQPTNNLKNVRDMLKEFNETHNNPHKNNNGDQVGLQKPKQVPLLVAEQQQNVSASIRENSPSNKQSEFIASSSSVKYKSKGIKKDRLPKKRKDNKRQQSQSVYNQQEQVFPLSIQSNNKEMAYKGQQVGNSQSHVSNENHSNLNKEVENEQSLQQVLQLEDQPVKQDKSKFVVKGICKRNEVFLYLIEDHGQKRWISKTDILRQHPLALIQFYQSKIKYYPATNQSNHLSLKQQSQISPVRGRAPGGVIRKTTMLR